MSALVIDNLPIMKKFSKMKPEDKRKLIIENDKFVQCVCEICLNLLKGNVPVKKPQKQKLHRHRNIIRRLAYKVKNVKNKRKLLQRGSGVFLPLLFSVVAPIITKLISGQ